MLRLRNVGGVFYVLNDKPGIRFTARLACTQASTVGNVLHVRVWFCPCTHSHSKGNQ
jgi:hypothetical protein